METPSEMGLEAGCRLDGTSGAVLQTSHVRPEYMSNLFIRWPRWTPAREVQKGDSLVFILKQMGSSKVIPFATLLNQ